VCQTTIEIVAVPFLHCPQPQKFSSISKKCKNYKVKKIATVEMDKWPELKSLIRTQGPMMVFK
jgi:hypothetical protein